jgi:hypothetical protein
MPNMPPNMNLNSEEEAYKIAETLRSACDLTAGWCESLANMTWPRFEAGLRNEGLDGGGRLSHLLHGGDARKTAKFVVAPLYVVQTDLLNAARSATVFGNRMRVDYFDARRAARAAKESTTGNEIPVK